jgi:hypothetical protein
MPDRFKADESDAARRYRAEAAEMPKKARAIASWRASLVSELGGPKINCITGSGTLSQGAGG